MPVSTQNYFKCFECISCGFNTITNPRRREYYMVTDKVWKAANPGVKGMLCIGCLEGRLHRKLTKKDFSDYPINNEPLGEHSIRLRRRLGLL